MGEMQSSLCSNGLPIPVFLERLAAANAAFISSGGNRIESPPYSGFQSRGTVIVMFEHPG